LACRFFVITAALDDLFRLTSWARDPIRPAQLVDGLIALDIIDEMLDVDLHGWTPVKDRRMGWHQCTPSSHATPPESNKSVRGLSRLGRWRIRPGSPRAYSPLSLAARVRLPVSPTMDSPTWFRWWFAAHPNRALRLPAWEEVKPGELLSIFQHAHVMHTVDTLPHHVESGQAAVLSGVVEQGVIFPKDETHFRCIHHAMS
jgi:hypothetical protein